MNFEINKRKRRMIGRSIGFTSRVFRAFAVVGIVLIALAPGAFVLVSDAFVDVKGADESLGVTFGTMAAAVLVVLGFVFPAAGFRASNFQFLGRRDESLSLSSGALVYGFRSREDATRYGRNVVLVDMTNASWHLEPRGRYIVFDSGARGYWDPGVCGNQPMPSFGQMEDASGIMLGLYWEPDLVSALQSFQVQAAHSYA